MMNSETWRLIFAINSALIHILLTVAGLLAFLMVYETWKRLYDIEKKLAALEREK